MCAHLRIRDRLTPTTLAGLWTLLVLLSFFALATASATLDDATTNENLPANTIVGTLSLGVGTGPTNQFNVGFTQKEANVTLTQSGYWKPATNTFRKFLVDESGDSLFGGFSGTDTDSTAQADFNSSGISGWSGMNETQKRRKVLETTGYYKLYKMSIDVNGSSNPVAIIRESRDGNVTETAWNPSWKDNDYEIRRIDVEGWNGDENGSYDRLRDKYLILPQNSKDDIFQVISTGEPATSNPVVGQLRDSYNLKYDQTTSSHGSSSHLHTSGTPADLAKNGSGDGTIKNTDYDGTTTEKWNVTYHNNGHKEFKITDDGAFNATTGEFSSVDRYSRTYADPDWRTNGLANPTQATDNLLANRQVSATKLANNTAVTNHDVASITKVSESTRSVQIGRKYEWNVDSFQEHTGWTGYSTGTWGSVNNPGTSWQNNGGWHNLTSSWAGTFGAYMTNGGDKKGNAGGMSSALSSYLNSYDDVQYYNSVHDDGIFNVDDWKLQTRYRNKTYSTNYTPSAWVFKQYYNETYEDFVFDLDTNWANLTDPRETLRYKFLATPADVMKSRTIVLSEGTGQTPPAATFSLVEGNGSQHNHLFSVDGNGRLKNAEPLDHETNATLSIRIRAVDDLNVSLEKTLVISVVDVPEAPSFASSGVTLSMPENNLASFSFTATDPDANTTLLYSLSGPDAGRFSLNVVTGILTLSQSADFENSNDADADGVYQVTINATDGEANATQSASIAISNANDAPVDMNLSGTTVPENQPDGIIVGELNATDPDANATVAFSFTDGNGSQHNSLFSLDANGTIRTTATFDYETNATALHIRVKATDEHNSSLAKTFVINVTNVVEDLDGDGIEDHFDPDDDGDGFSDAVEVDYGSDPRNANSVANQAPSSIDLNGTTVAENQVAGTIVGEFNAIDPDANATIALAFADGNGSQHNNLFTIDGNGTLKTAAIFDYETNATTFNVRVKATDEHNASLAKTFAISLLNVNEPPADLNSTAPLSMAENQPIGTIVGEFNATDPDANPNLTFTLVEGSNDNHLFAMDTNGTLRTVAVFDYETNATFTIRAKVRDQYNAWIKENFTITITNVVEDLDGDGIEDHFDPDDDGDGFSDAEEIDYGSDPRNANSVANQAPTLLDLNGTTVPENQSAGTIVGEFNATDPDANATIVFAFAHGLGDDHNHLFAIDANGTLRTAAILDHEANASWLEIRVKAIDEHNASLEKGFAIHVSDDDQEDTDGDGLKEFEEDELGTSDLNDDSDGDGSKDNEEIVIGSDPDSNASRPVTLSGTVTYDGDHNGTVHVFAREGFDGMITIEMIDSYGDGWNGNELTIVGDGNNTLYSTTLPSGHQGSEMIELIGGRTYTVNVGGGQWMSEVSWEIRAAGEILASGEAPATSATLVTPGSAKEVVLPQLGNYQMTLASDQAYEVFAFLDVDGNDRRVPLEPAGFHSSEPIFVDGNLSGINIDMIDNAAPTDLALSAGPVRENQPRGSIVGLFSVTDPDDANGSGNYSFYLASGEGSQHNDRFTIEGNQLKVVSPDYESGSIHSIRVRAKDAHGATIEKTFSIVVTDDPSDNPIKVFDSIVSAPDTVANDNFGNSISQSGDLLAVGAPDASIDDQPEVGAAYLFRMEANGSITYLTKVSSPDGSKEDKFGTSVSLSGNLLVVGAPQADTLDENQTGSVYLYRVEHNGTASHLAKLTVPDGAKEDKFGTSVSLSGNLLAVAAPYANIVDKWDVGAVYLYRVESNGTSSHLAKLTAPDGSSYDRFGNSITLTGNTLAVGASRVGAVYLYRTESNGTATYMSKLTALDGSEGDYFGDSVDIGVDLLAVAAPYADIDGKENAGAVYLYRTESDGNATYLTKLTAPDSNLSYHFGRSISLSGDLIAVALSNGIYLFQVSPDDSTSSLGKIYYRYANVVSLSDLRLVSGRRSTNTGGEAYVIDHLSSLNNTAPSDLHISNSSVTENEANDTAVGDLHAIDSDDQNGSGDHFYEFVDGNGSDHNILFRIDENGTLRTKTTFDHEVNATLSIRVRTTDEYDASFEKIFTINVANVVEDLDGDGIENHADPDDDGDGFTDTEEIEGGSNPDDNASFLVTVSGTVTYMGNSTGKVRVFLVEKLEGEIEIEMIDSYGDGWNGSELTISDDANVTVYVGTFETGYEARDTIEVIPGRTYFVNVSDGEYPNEVSWNIFSNNKVLASGDTSSEGESFLAPGLVTEIALAQTGTYQLTALSNLPFLVGAFLDLDDDGRIAPLEPAALHSAEPIVATGDLSGINIEMVDNVAPTNLSLSIGPVIENRQAGSFVGIFSATDPDDLNGTDSYFFDLVEGNGSDHNHHFTIEGNQLKAVSPDYESGPIHSIRVRASDDRGAFLEKSFFITVIDDPMDNPLELESSTLFSDEDQFGSAVALLGDLLAIGSTRASGVDENETGAAYLYGVEANGSTTYLTKLLAPDGSAGDEFGGSISLSHDLLAVGAARASGVNDNQTGAAYLYGIEDNGSNTYLTKLTAPDGIRWDYFGRSISLSQDVLAVGATRASGVDENWTGAVYLYGIEANGTTNYLTKLTAPDGSQWDYFGSSISQSDNLLAVGAGRADMDGKENAGAVYLYRMESNGTGTYLTKLSAPDGVAHDWFGSSVSVLNNIIVVSASGADHNGTGDVGAAYVFRVDSNESVTYLTKLTARDANAYSYFGNPVSQTGDLLAVGSAIGTYLYRMDANGSSITTLGKATLQGEPIGENFQTAAISVSGELLAVGIKLESPEDETDEDEEGEGDSGEETSVVHVLSLSNLNNNRLPSDLRLSNATVDENKNPGTLVGQLQVVDPDDQNGTDQYHFELVDGNGSQHNHLFTQTNGELKTKAFLDYETNDTLSIRVRVSDKYNGTLEIPLEVKVIDTFAPIVRTLTVETDANGSATFRGKILTDGNSEVTVVGVKVSDGLNFVNPMILPGTLNGSTGEFTVMGTGLAAGTRYYYRAYAINAEGTGHGARKRLVTPQSSSTSPPWWANTEEADAGWRVSTWFGAFRPYENGWVYHADLGWLYALSDGEDGLWIWNDAKGWLWTNPGSYRYLYSSNLSEWLYFLKSKDGRAYFYNYATGSVE